MKFLIIAFVACAYADVSELGYNYKQNDIVPLAAAPAPLEPAYVAPVKVAPAPKPVLVETYVPPPQPKAVAEVVNTYLPPPPPQPVAEVVNTYVPPPQPQPVAEVVNTYVPPPQPQPVAKIVNTYVPPVSVAPLVHVQQSISSFVPALTETVAQPIAPAEEIEVVPADGYRYKTVRRVVYRKRN